MARLLDFVLHHQETIERFLHSAETGRLPHTFLFVGPSGVGRKTVALALSQALLCERSPRACGICGSCLRISAVASPALSSKKQPAPTRTESLLLIAPEKNQIRMEQAHEVIEFLSLRSLGKNRVVIMDGVDALNTQAANALLKSLEEPPDGTFFFLIAPSAGHVLPTLRSRAQVVAFQPLPVAEMKKKAVTAPEWALKASQGSFERLAQLLERDQLELCENALQWLRDWSHVERGYLHPENRELVRDRASARSLAHHLSWLLRDALYLKLGASDKILNSDKITSLQAISDPLSEAQLLLSCEKALTIEQKLDANQDSSLVFEQFWLETRPL